MNFENKWAIIFKTALLLVAMTLFAGLFRVQAAKWSTDAVLSETVVRQKWRAFEKLKDSIQPKGDYPYRACFERAAEKYDLPMPLLLAVARGESNFDKNSVSTKDCYGVMQIQWPGTAKYLGITRKADLFSPCINIDAGGKYLKELLERFNGDTYLALAAYNYGPTRIRKELYYGAIPEGARWYAAYIHDHLEYVRMKTYVDTGRVLVFEPNKSLAHAMRMKQHFETMTAKAKWITLEIFRSNHYTYDLYLTYSPGKREKAVAEFKKYTGATPIEIKQAEGGSQ